MPEPDVSSSINNWIYVTGVIRSGTTFVGDMLSRGLRVDYIHEPFLGGYTLPDRRPLVPAYVPPDDIHSPEAHAYDAQLKALLEYRIGIPSARYDKDPGMRKALKSLVGSRGPFYLRIARINPLSRTSVIKDPYGKLAAERLHVRFGVKPVIVVKHPVSLAASLERVGWWPDLSDFRTQDRLRERFLPHEEAFFARSWPTRMHESMAHWRVSYKILLDQADEHGWSIVVHETLSSDPVSEFSDLFDRLGMTFKPSIARRVRKMTSAGTASARQGRVQDFKRDSARIFEQRRAAIPVAVRREIYEIVADVALRLYDRESFALD